MEKGFDWDSASNDTLHSVILISKQVKNMDQKRIGIVLSYCYLILNCCVGIVFTPFMLRKLGNSEYGLYQLVQSISSYLIIANCGTGTAMTRYISEFRTLNDKNKEYNYVFHNLIIATITSLLIAVLGAVLLYRIPVLFPKFTAAEIHKAKILFLFLVLNIVLSTYTNAFSGYVIAYEKFVFTNGWSNVKIILRVLSIVILLNLGYDSIVIVLTDFLLNVIYLLALLYVCVFRLKMRVKFLYFDKKMLMSTAVFSIAILLQAIVNQVNQNVDKTVLGMMLSTFEVTVYSIAMNIFVIFVELPMAIGSVFLPKVTSMICAGKEGRELQNLSSRIGRIQFILTGMVFTGFLLFGRNFMYCWVGKSIGDSVTTAWLTAIIIMLPAAFVASNGICNTILDAKEKRMVRSLVLVFIAVINVVLTVVLIKKIGMIGAPIATSIASVMGNFIVMPIYFKKVLHIDYMKMYRDIIKGTMLCLIISAFVCYPLVKIFSYSWFTLVLEIIVFLVIFAVLMFFIGFSKDEKKKFTDAIRNIKYKLINSRGSL